MAPELNPIFSVFGENVSPEATITEDADDLTSCDKSISPACIAALYGIPPTDGACAGNSLGIYSEGQYAQKTLNNFFANASTKIPLGTHPNLANVDGGSVAPSSDLVSLETELDLQIAYPIIYPQNITLFEVDTHANGTGFMNTFLDSIDGVCYSA
jgi:tripeptidyl-peptidase-1